MMYIKDLRITAQTVIKHRLYTLYFTSHFLPLFVPSHLNSNYGMALSLVNKTLSVVNTHFLHTLKLNKSLDININF